MASGRGLRLAAVAPKQESTDALSKAGHADLWACGWVQTGDRASPEKPSDHEKGSPEDPP